MLSTETSSAAELLKEIGATDWKGFMAAACSGCAERNPTSCFLLSWYKVLRHLKLRRAELTLNSFPQMSLEINISFHLWYTLLLKNFRICILKTVALFVSAIQYRPAPIFWDARSRIRIRCKIILHHSLWGNVFNKWKIWKFPELIWLY